MDMRRAVVITNANAGSNDERTVEAAVRRLRSGGIEVDVAATSEVGELSKVLEERDGREVVVAGGDGSLHAVIARLYSSDSGRDAVVGLIPLGTGNDFARGAGIPLDPEPAADVIVGAHRRTIDLVVDEVGGVVVNAVHVGVGADAGREAQQWKPRLGKLGYVVGALVAGVRSRGEQLRIEADDRLLAAGGRRILQVAISNGAFVGGGTAVAPDADPTDAALDLVVSFAVSPGARLAYGLRLRRGTHDERADVVTTRAKQVRLSGEPFHANADGELSGPMTSRAWRIEPAVLDMYLPE
jgi:diacylglycerol kinase (ATP)